MSLEFGTRIHRILARGTALDRLFTFLTTVSLLRVKNMATNALVSAFQINVEGPARLALQTLAIFIEVCNLSVASETLWLAILHSTLNTIDQLIATLFALGFSARLVEVIATQALDAHVFVITGAALLRTRIHLAVLTFSIIEPEPFRAR